MSSPGFSHFPIIFLPTWRLKDGRKSRDHCHSSHFFVPSKTYWGPLAASQRNRSQGGWSGEYPESGWCGRQVFFVFHVLGVIFPANSDEWSQGNCMYWNIEIQWNSTNKGHDTTLSFCWMMCIIFFSMTKLAKKNPRGERKLGAFENLGQIYNDLSARK